MTEENPPDIPPPGFKAQVIKAQGVLLECLDLNHINISAGASAMVGLIMSAMDHNKVPWEEAEKYFADVVKIAKEQYGKLHT
jgi:hypothetical protein